MKIVLAGQVSHEIKVTRIKPSLWGVRCFTNGVLNQEIQVRCRFDIGVAAADMLRWEDKCGNFSQEASASRKRFQEQKKFRGYQMKSNKISV